jgi:hypothetical protein
MMSSFSSEQLARIPRTLLERHQVCPLPSPRANKTGLVQVFCMWDPNDLVRRHAVETTLQPYLSSFRIEFIQPLVPSPDEYLRRLLDALYAVKRPERGSPTCSFCGQDGRLLASASAAICARCIGSDPPPEISAVMCSFCSHPAPPIRGCNQFAICDECLAFAISILK